MYKDTDYDTLERNVKYIPWKGKKEEWYTWHKTFLVRAMTRGYHGILVGLESVPSDEVAKMLAGYGNDVCPEKEIQQLQTKYQGLRGPSTMLHPRYCVLWYRRRIKRQRVIQRQFKTCVETSI